MPLDELSCEPVGFADCAKEGCLDRFHPARVATDGDFCAWGWTTISGACVDVAVSLDHRHILPDSGEFHGSVDDGLSNCHSLGDVEVGFIHSSKFITDESAVHVWLRRLENVGKRVLFVGDSGTVVAAEIDVDVEFAGGGVDVIVCVDGVEEHEVGSFVCCNTFVTGELGVWG